MVDEKYIASLQARFPALDVSAISAEARAWIEANPPRKFTKKFLTNWVIREAQRARSSPRPRFARPMIAPKEGAADGLADLSGPTLDW